MGTIGNSCKEDDVISCQRIVVQNAGTKQISRNLFEIQKEVKDTGINDMMERMYHISWISLNEELISRILMTNRLDEISNDDKTISQDHGRSGS